MVNRKCVHPMLRKSTDKCFEKIDKEIAVVFATIHQVVVVLHGIIIKAEHVGLKYKSMRPLFLTKIKTFIFFVSRVELSQLSGPRVLL